MTTNRVCLMNNVVDEQCAIQLPMPKFSVIMPCYNSAAYVREAILSVINQQYSNWELIVVNDGSTDNTLDILYEFAKQDNRIQIHSKENGGYVSAVNFGLTKFTGDYFLFMGSDDSLSIDLFYDICNNMRDLPDCIAFRTIKKRNNSMIGRDNFTCFDTVVYEKNISFAEFCEKYPKHSEIFSTRDTSKCFKRKLLGNKHFLGRYGIDADGIFSMMLCQDAHSFLAVPTDGYFWTLRDDSLSSRKSSLLRECDRVENWITFYNFLKDIPINQITRSEKEYLQYFFDILSDIRYYDMSVKLHHALIIKAAYVIKKLVLRWNVVLVTTRSQKLLLNLPVIWILYARVVNTLASVKNRLYRAESI